MESRLVFYRFEQNQHSKEDFIDFIILVDASCPRSWPSVPCIANGVLRIQEFCFAATGLEVFLLILLSRYTQRFHGLPTLIDDHSGHAPAFGTCRKV